MNTSITNHPIFNIVTECPICDGEGRREQTYTVGLGAYYRSKGPCSFCHETGLVYSDYGTAVSESVKIQYQNAVAEELRLSIANDALHVTIEYTNYKGVTATRRIIPKKLWFGATEYHPQEQWLLRAYDLDKSAYRDFALVDFGHKK